MVRYALPYMHRGNLHVGDDAPDARLVALGWNLAIPHQRADRGPAISAGVRQLYLTTLPSPGWRH